MIELSSPKIRCNKIINNVATDINGVLSAGGGGIRIGDGNPIIENNLISGNQGRYGPGIVLNYTGCMIRNNLIVSNTGGQDYHGGSGIWMTNNLSSTPKIIVNNTIVNNFCTVSAGTGTGGILIWNATNVIIKNNILWGNLPSQIKVLGTAPSVTYCDVEGGYTGTGNINSNPLFAADCFMLDSISPCIDAGDTASLYDDVQYNNMALFPSQKTPRNDMGSFGGPFAGVCSCSATATGVNENIWDDSVEIFPNPSNVLISIHGSEIKAGKIEITDISGRKIKTFNFQNTFSISDLEKGVYFLKITSYNTIITKKIIKD